jgi:hypothetical protein
MTNFDRDFWNKYHCPLTIVADRYTGAYSGGKFVAYPVEFDEIPPDVDGDDVDCATFWGEEHPWPVGRGETPEEAFQDLKEKMARAD